MRWSSSAAFSLALAFALVTPAPARAETAPSAQDRGSARRLLEAGKDAFRAARFEDAAKLFGEAYAKDPSLDAALFNQAYALRRAERYADARAAYRRYLALHPEDLDTHYALGRTAQLLGDVEDARKWYSSYVEKEKRAERSRYVEHARAQLALLPAAIVQTEPAVVVEAPAAAPPYDAAARFAEGMKRYQEKRYRDAAAIFLEVFEHDEQHTRALYRHALALRQAGDLDAARAAYERFLTLVPNDPDGVYGLAETERASKNSERAIALYERYLDVERRPSEEKWRERAREYIAVLRAGLAKPAAPEEPVVAGGAAPSDEAPPEEPPAADPQTPAPQAPAPQAPAPVDVSAAPPAEPAFGPRDAHRPRLVRVAALTPSVDEAPAPPAVSLGSLLDEGEAKLASKDADGALRAFQRALAFAPSSARPHWGLARAYELAGQTSAAKHHYRVYREHPAADREEQKADAAWWKIETLP